MKISVKTSVLITVILTAILNASTPVCRAQDQTETANLVAVSTVPASGTFWSMQLTNFPPLPFDPLPDLPLYTDGQFYFYDDRSVSYPADWSPFPVVASSGSGGMAMDDGPPSPGGFGTGSGGGSGGGGTAPFITFTPPGSGYTNCETWTNFWLEIANSSNTIQITISNTLAGMSYNLLETTNLNNPGLGCDPDPDRHWHVHPGLARQRRRERDAFFPGGVDDQRSGSLDNCAALQSGGQLGRYGSLHRDRHGT